VFFKVVKSLIHPAIYFFILPRDSLVPAAVHGFLAEFCELTLCCIQHDLQVVPGASIAYVAP
jgi:hypothetical protein